MLMNASYRNVKTEGNEDSGDQSASAGLPSYQEFNIKH